MKKMDEAIIKRFFLNFTSSHSHLTYAEAREERESHEQESILVL